MKNKKTLKTLKWKYNTVKIYMFAIVVLILISLVGAWYLYSNGHNFSYSTLLNVFGGLFTGLILLSYQYLSNKNIREANIVVEKLNLINEVSVFYANELDFCTDATKPSQEQMESCGIGITTILEDNEGAAYALTKYKEEILKAENQFSIIKDFLNNVLQIPLDYSEYEKKLIQIKQFFSPYSEEIEYAMPPYFLRKHSELENPQLEDYDEIIEIFETEKVMNTYLNNNQDILENSLYYIDPPGEQYEVRVVFKNNTKVLIGDVYKDWIQKMKDLEESTKIFNELFLESKEKILSTHNKNLNIIH